MGVPRDFPGGGWGILRTKRLFFSPPSQIRPNLKNVDQIPKIWPAVAPQNFFPIQGEIEISLNDEPGSFDLKKCLKMFCDKILFTAVLGNYLSRDISF